MSKLNMRSHQPSTRVAAAAEPWSASDAVVSPRPPPEDTMQCSSTEASPRDPHYPIFETTSYQTPLPRSSSGHRQPGPMGLLTRLAHRLAPVELSDKHPTSPSDADLETIDLRKVCMYIWACIAGGGGGALGSFCALDQCSMWQCLRELLQATLMKNMLLKAGREGREQMQQRQLPELPEAPGDLMLTHEESPRALGPRGEMTPQGGGQKGCDVQDEGNQMEISPLVTHKPLAVPDR
jgi:hypothetical protein